MSPRLSLQLPSCAAAFGYLPSVLSALNEKHARLGWDQLTDSAIELGSISLPWETLELLLQYDLGHYLFAPSSRFYSIWLNLSRECVPVRIHPVPLICGHVISEHWQPYMPLITSPPSCLMGTLQTRNYLFPFPHFLPRNPWPCFRMITIYLQ